MLVENMVYERRLLVGMLCPVGARRRSASLCVLNDPIDTPQLTPWLLNVDSEPRWYLTQQLPLRVDASTAQCRVLWLVEKRPSVKSAHPIVPAIVMVKESSIRAAEWCH